MGEPVSDRLAEIKERYRQGAALGTGATPWMVGEIERLREVMRQQLGEIHLNQEMAIREENKRLAAEAAIECARAALQSDVTGDCYDCGEEGGTNMKCGACTAIMHLVSQEAS